MTNFLPHQLKLEDISLLETDTSNTINSELNLTDFIGFPFNFQNNPELEDDIKSKINENIKKIQSELNLQTPKIFGSPKFSVYTQKKRGRIKKDKNNNKQHGKYEEDNIIRKIQVSYISFLTNFVNTVLKAIGRNDLDFTPLNYNFKRIVNKEHRTKLKNSIIEEVLKRTSSPKFSTKDKNINIYICETIKKENINILIDILNKEFLFFFDKIYLKNYRKFNLKEFGLADLNIELPNTIELYQDLLFKNKNDIHYEKYKKLINSCIKKHFLPKRKEIFKCNY